MKTRRPRGRKRSGGSGVAKHAASVSAGKDISKGISESEWAGLADATNKGASKEDVTAPAQSIARETSASGFARKAAAKAAKASNPTDSIAAKHGVEKIGEFGGEAAAGLVAAKILKKGITRSISAIKALRSGSSADAGELAAADTASAAESTASTLTGDAATAAAGAAAEAAAADSAADIAADAGEVAADAT